MIRRDLQDKIYKTEKGKFKAIVDEVKQLHAKGQPILIGTISIEKNEYLGMLLRREGIKCEILNAKQHEKEGAIIAQAGKLDAVTVATNMAGRGVDIVLGGNPQDTEEAQKVKELGGLHVLGTERHEARRIDNQLRGRSGRQGDSGSTQFFVSLEDELMQRFGADRIKNLMDMLKVPEDQPIENKMISSAIEKAQMKIEGYNFDIRKHVLDYDEVMNKQRETIYNMRKEILFDVTDEEMHNKVKELMDDEGFKEYEEKIKNLPANEVGNVERFVMLRTIDMLWMEHLETMECLRDSVSLRAYGQRDPLVEYKNEGYRLFKHMMNEIDNSIVEMLLKVELKHQGPISNFQSNSKSQISKPKNTGRNDPCPCGSGKKYKKCHGK